MQQRWLSVALALIVAAVSPVFIDARDAAVAARMRNVVLHLDKGVELRVSDLSGHLISRVKNTPPGTPRSRT